MVNGHEAGAGPRLVSNSNSFSESYYVKLL